MTQEELLQVIQRRGFEARIQKDEVVLKECLFCGNPNWNLELNLQRGIYNCWACDEGRGTLRALLANEFKYTANIPVNYEAPGSDGPTISPDHHDITCVPALEIESAMRYLERRGITRGDVIRHRIVFCTDERSPLKHRILFPVKEYFTQQMVGYVGRSYSGQEPKYMASYPTRTIAGYRYWSAVHVVVEGPIDGIAVHRANYSAAVMLGQTNDQLEEWAARIPPDEWIVLLLDGSAHSTTEELYWKLFPIHPRTAKFLLPENIDPGQLAPEAVAGIVTHTLERSAASVS